MINIVYRFDKQLFFPQLDPTLKMWSRVFNKRHTGTGPDGMMDDVYTWIMELLLHHAETGEVLQCHYVPGITKYSKPVRLYEHNFLEIAIALLRRLPATAHNLFHVTTQGRHLVVMFTYDETLEDQPIPAILQDLSVEQFLRPNKIPKNQLNMTNLEKP